MKRRYWLSPHVVLRLLEVPCVYHLLTDELYELDQEGFEFLRQAALHGVEAPGDDPFVAYCLKEGLLSTAPRNGTPPELRPAPRPSLRYLELQLTEDCNLRCRHCYQEHRAIEMAPHDVLWVLQEFSQAQGLRVLLTGGEPLRHSQFWQINAQLPKFSLRKVLFTNGLLLDEPTAKALNVQEVQISLDGLRDSHEALRGPGTFGKALRAIEAARAAGLEVSVATMAHSGNLHELPALECLLRDLGVSTWSVDVPVLTRGAAKTLVPPPERAGKALAFGFGKRASHGSQEGYACGLNLMSVSAKGEAARCSFYRPVGNVLKEGLLPCWQRIRPLRLSELRCRHCPHLQQCRGGCRYRAESLGQDPLSKDLYRCALYGIIQK